MTSLVTALGLLPLAVGMGASGREVEGPMAVVILGGLMTSIVLNLLLLPTLALAFGRFGPEEKKLPKHEAIRHGSAPHNVWSKCDSEPTRRAFAPPIEFPCRPGQARERDWVIPG